MLPDTSTMTSVRPPSASMFCVESSNAVSNSRPNRIVPLCFHALQNRYGSWRDRATCAGSLSTAAT